MVRLISFAIAACAVSFVAAVSHDSGDLSKDVYRRAVLQRRHHNRHPNTDPSQPAKRATRRSSKKSSSCAAKNTNTTDTTTTDNSNDTTTTDDTNSGNSTTIDDTSSGNSTTTDGGSTGAVPGTAGSDSKQGTVAALLPPSGIKSGWTMGKDTVAPVKKVTLTDSSFVREGESKLAHPVVAIAGKQAIHSNFKKGSYTLRSSPVPAGGFSFYAPRLASGPNVDLSNAKEVSFAFSLYLSPNFDCNMGGKLPGLYGGISPSAAKTASGGRHSDVNFSTRFMFRDSCKGELYLYVPMDANRKNMCGKTGQGACYTGSSDGKQYGASVGTGLWHFKVGGWTTVRQVIHLNTPGQRDGWAKIFVNGAASPVLNLQNISFRTRKDSVFQGLQMQTFFGGHEPIWAPKHDQDSYFADMTIAVTETE